MKHERDRILSAFGQGEACSRRGGYRADCPYMPSQEILYQAWHEGFDNEEGPRYQLAKNMGLAAKE